jgi:isopenicillin N synthase-like dioxygenase
MNNMQQIGLKEHGYVFIPHQIDKEIIQRLISKWIEFYNQPLEHKKTFVFNEYGGYEYKGPESLDFKENFHFSLEYIKKDFRAYNGTDMNLFNIASGFLHENKVLVKEVVELFCKDSLSEEQIEEAVLNAQLRFLHYPPRDFVEGGILAIPHVDKGITIHFTEDAPGFQILWKEKWIDVRQMASHILVYPGLLGQYYSKCEFPALCHRVVNTNEASKNGRNSIVMFIDPGDVTYNKKDYGKTQETFSKGENYNLTFDTFKDFFTTLENKVL